MSDRIFNFNLEIPGGEDTPSLNISRTAYLKQLLQTTAQPSTQGSPPNYYAHLNGQSSQRNSLLQQQLEKNHPTTFQQVQHQPQLLSQQERQIPMAVTPVVQQPIINTNSYTRNDQKFTLRQGGSSFVAFNASLHISEIEAFGRNILQTCQSVDQYIYDAFILKETVIPNLETKNAALKKELDELVMEKEKLAGEKQDLERQANILGMEVSNEQAKTSSLTGELKSREQQMIILTMALENVKKELNQKREELESSVDDFEKMKLNVQRKEETIQHLESHQQRLKNKRVTWRRTCKKRATEVSELQTRNDALQGEIRTLKQTVRTREAEIDNLKAEVDTVKLEALDYEEEGTTYKKECEDMKMHVAKLKASVEQEKQLRKKLEEMCPNYMKSSLEKSVANIKCYMEQRKRIMAERKRRSAESPSTVEASPPKKLAVDSTEQQKNGRGKIKVKIMKRDNEQEKKISNKRKDMQDCKHGNIGNHNTVSKGGKMMDEILITDNSEDEENSGNNSDKRNGDLNQKQGSSKVKITLPQWKLLQESASSALSAVGLGNAPLHDGNKVPIKTSVVSVTNHNNLIMKFKKTTK